MEPYGTAAGTAPDFQKPQGILQSEMVEASRNRPEPRMEPCAFVGSLSEYWQFCLSGLLLIKILKIKKAGTEFEALAAEGMEEKRRAYQTMTVDFMENVLSKESGFTIRATKEENNIIFLISISISVCGHQ